MITIDIFNDDMRPHTLSLSFSLSLTHSLPVFSFSLIRFNLINISAILTCICSCEGLHINLSNWIPISNGHAFTFNDIKIQSQYEYCI